MGKSISFIIVYIGMNKTKGARRNMARFNLSERMAEVELSMCAGENCNMIDGKNMKGRPKDNEVVFFENDNLDIEPEKEKDKN